ncbi:MAG: DUF4349 domain-containing protein [Nitrosarchaeum sp.]|nr:DUF4349 domain-containing protein [Nitrosarchaeum sp.]
MEEKLMLEDRIFDQERRIEYLEDALILLDRRVEYATLLVDLREEPSVFARAGVAQLADLLQTLVGSVNALLYLVFAVLPWVAFAGVGYGVVVGVRRLFGRVVKRK